MEEAAKRIQAALVKHGYEASITNMGTKLLVSSPKQSFQAEVMLRGDGTVHVNKDLPMKAAKIVYAAFQAS